MVQGFRQLADSAVDLSTRYTDPVQKERVLNMAVGMGIENALLYDVIMLINRDCSDVLDKSFYYKQIEWIEELHLEHHLLVEVLVNGGPRKKKHI
jgi:hypothetical protein